ncbi:MAG: hypothetical protein OXC66_06395 [Roseovarius sp.]|nr:hypothetical protein [Roseovarius sp.]
MSKKTVQNKAGEPHAKSGGSREDRLKAALKANLSRRKAQARARNLDNGDIQKERN